MADENVKTTESGYEVASGAALSDATLGGIDGLGTLQILRSDTDGGDVIEANGTWRLADEEGGQDTSSLKEGEVVTYKGRLDDPKHPDKDSIEVKVRISHVRTYTYNEVEGEPEHTLYRFGPEEPLSL